MTYTNLLNFFKYPGPDPPLHHYSMNLRYPHLSSRFMAPIISYNKSYSPIPISKNFIFLKYFITPFKNGKSISSDPTNSHHSSFQTLLSTLLWRFQLLPLIALIQKLQRLYVCIIISCNTSSPSHAFCIFFFSSALNPFLMKIATKFRETMIPAIFLVTMFINFAPSSGQVVYNSPLPPAECAYPCLPPPTSVVNCPPPPSPPSGSGSMNPPPSDPGSIYYYPPSSGVFPYIPPPPVVNYPAPPPPDPILPYFPYYYKIPPPPPGTSAGADVGKWASFVIFPLILLGVLLG